MSWWTWRSQIGPEGGIWGSRMSGGGFGGCTISLLNAPQAQSVKRQLADAYQRRTGMKLDAFVSCAVDGARVLATQGGEVIGA